MVSCQSACRAVQFDTAADGSIVVDVQQSVRDLEGRPLQDQTHGLRDKMVGHVFHFQDGKIVRFDIQDTLPESDLILSQSAWG